MVMTFDELKAAWIERIKTHPLHRRGGYFPSSVPEEQHQTCPACAFGMLHQIIKQNNMIPVIMSRDWMSTAEDIFATIREHYPKQYGAIIGMWSDIIRTNDDGYKPELDHVNELDVRNALIEIIEKQFV